MWIHRKAVLNILEELHNKKKQKNQQIVFISQYSKPRMLKMAYALQKKGYKVILFLDKSNWESLDCNARKYFVSVLYFCDKDDAYKKCLRYKPLVYHVFTEASVPEWAEYLVKQKKNLEKLVYDQYDVYRGLQSDNMDVYARREKYCLENADGLCCRMFETQYLKQKYGYCFQGKRILFFDYCWNLYHYKGNSKHNCLRMVYGGRLIQTSSNESYKMELRGIRYIAKLVQRQGDYFIIISSRKLSRQYGVYRRLQKQFRHVILKEPMDFSKLIAYESHMDYGLDCIELSEDVRQNRHRAIKNKYYATNKYFDYLDAGIMPLYGREGEMFGRYLERYGGAVKCTLEEMPEKLVQLKEDREVNKEKARKARSIMAIEKQIDRLIKFYEILG